jgi:uncharacterized DUF497 family protein
MVMKFEWHEQKNTINRNKHGITFIEAITAFDDPFALITLDEKHSENEKREWLIGKSDIPGGVVVIFTVRFKNIYRIISARPASRKEKLKYEEVKRISI